MGIIFSRLKQAGTNTNAVRKLPSVQRETYKRNFKEAIQTEQKYHQQDIMEANDKNTKQEIVNLRNQINSLKKQKEILMKQVRQKNSTYYELIINLETSINQTQEQIEKLESQEIDKLRNQYRERGLQCTYQHATKKIGTGGTMLGGKTSCPFTVNLKSKTLYEIPTKSAINLVQYYPPVANDENYKLDMYNKVRDYNDNTTVHHVDNDGKHTIMGPMISVDIRRSGSVDFITYDNEGNKLDNIHKDQDGNWN